MPPDGTLGILAGAGSLPRSILAEAARQGRPVFVIGFRGHTDPDTVRDVPHRWLRLGQAGRAVRALRQAGVGDVVLAGAIRRPSLSELRPDWYAVRFFARLGRQALGDDGLLRAVAGLLEGEGFRVVGAATLLRDALAAPGAMGAIQPSPIHHSDIAHGMRVVAALGGLDIGQAAVVQQGVVLGLEAAEGTDALIARCGILARAGFAGLAVEAGRTLILDPAAVAARANAAGLFVIAVRSDG